MKLKITKDLVKRVLEATKAAKSMTKVKGMTKDQKATNALLTFVGNCNTDDIDGFSPITTDRYTAMSEILGLLGLKIGNERVHNVAQKIVPMFTFVRVKNSGKHSLVLNTKGGHIWTEDSDPVYDPDLQKASATQTGVNGLKMDAVEVLYDPVKIKKLLGLTFTDSSCGSTTSILINAGFLDKVEDKDDKLTLQDALDAVTGNNSECDDDEDKDEEE